MKTRTALRRDVELADNDCKDAAAGHPSTVAVRRGRPTGYEPSRCNEIIEIMSKGYSLTAASALMGVSRGTIYVWCRAHAEFLHALGVAKAKRLFKLESDLLNSTNPAVINRTKWLLRKSDRAEWGRKPRRA